MTTLEVIIMTNRKGGYRRKTRHKLAKSVGERGKVSITRHLQEFSIGDRVNLNIEPSIHKGMFEPKFQGKSGIVVGKQGKCYQVEIKDISKTKRLVIHPVHLTR